MESTVKVEKVARVRLRGKVKKGKLILPEKLDLPDGEVELTIVRSDQSLRLPKGLTLEELRTHPAFGILKHRKDIKSGAAYIARLRGREGARSKRGR